MLEITPDIIRKAAEAYAADQNHKINFYASDLCKRMIADMHARKGVLCADAFSYYPDRVRAAFNWYDVSDADIKTFINVMSSTDSRMGVVENYRIDEECPFENYQFEKDGITIDVMIGQGSAVSLSVGE